MTIDLPAIRARAAEFEAAREGCPPFIYMKSWNEGLCDSLLGPELDHWDEHPYLGEAPYKFAELARNTTLAADVRGLIEEVERLRMLVNKNGDGK